MEATVQDCTEGLTWGETFKLEPVAYGIKTWS
jgi:hypothetical protein